MGRSTFVCGSGTYLNRKIPVNFQFKLEIKSDVYKINLNSFSNIFCGTWMGSASLKLVYTSIRLNDKFVCVYLNVCYV